MAITIAPYATLLASASTSSSTWLCGFTAIGKYSRGKRACSVTLSWISAAILDHFCWRSAGMGVSHGRFWCHNSWMRILNENHALIVMGVIMARRSYTFADCRRIERLILSLVMFSWSYHYSGLMQWRVYQKKFKVKKHSPNERAYKICKNFQLAHPGSPTALGTSGTKINLIYQSF